MSILTNYIPASKVIEQRCLRDEDLGLSKAAIYLSYLPTVYNDLRFDGTKKTTFKKFYINKENNTLAIPNDCMLLIAVGYYDDCGSIQGMWYNDSLPKDILFDNSQSCDCQSCDHKDSYCSAVQEFDNVEDVVNINGDEYTNITKTSILHDGRIIQYTKTWVLSDGSGDSGEEVISIENTKEICSLELRKCGCIAKTQKNKEHIEKIYKTCCGLSTNGGRFDGVCEHAKDPHSFTLDIQGKLIVLSPHYKRDYVILKYISAIGDAGEYQVPSIALECVLAGLKYYYESNSDKAPAFTRGQNGMYHRMYTAEMKKLQRRLRPLPYLRYLNSMGVVPYYNPNPNSVYGFPYNNFYTPTLNT